MIMLVRVPLASSCVFYTSEMVCSLCSIVEPTIWGPPHCAKLVHIYMDNHMILS